MIRETARDPGCCAKSKKCSIARANIVHFGAFKLHQNVSYKPCLENTPNALEFGVQTPVMPKEWG